MGNALPDHPSVAVLVTAILTWVNCRGVEAGKKVQNFFTIAKSAGLVALILVGLTVAANIDVLRANLGNTWGAIRETPR